MDKILSNDNNNVISMNGKTSNEVPTQAEPERIPNTFEFYKDGEQIATSTGFLNLAPDFAAVVSPENDVLFVAQGHAYDYVKNLGPAA